MDSMSDLLKELVTRSALDVIHGWTDARICLRKKHVGNGARRVEVVYYYIALSILNEHARFPEHKTEK